MNKDNAKEYLPLVQALAEGKMLQSLLGDTWIDIYNPVFNLNASNYRIKPEPIKKWYRVAQFKKDALVAGDELVELAFERHINFIKWLTPRVEYIVEEE